ncbi:MAG: glucose 1-dehydrogenase [Pigmentiphaga sp.]
MMNQKNDAMPSLYDKTALIVGGSQGLGLAIAQGLSRAGARIVLVARSEDKLIAAQKQLQQEGAVCRFIVADATDPAQVRACVEQVSIWFPGIDVLVNAAGGSLRQNVLDMSDDAWRKTVSMNLDSAFFFCREVGRHMTRARRGSIINLASTAGLRGRKGNTPYAASKAAVISLTKSLAMEWAETGVRVNAISPGRFLTPLTEAEMSDPDKYARFVTQVPLGRIGDPEEIVWPALWLASDASSFVTGANIVLDGGQTVD